MNVIIICLSRLLDLLSLLLYNLSTSSPHPPKRTDFFFNKILNTFPFLLFFNKAFPFTSHPSRTNSRAISGKMLISPIAFVLLALSFLGRPPLVTADTLERLQCWCRKRASHHDAHNDASYLRAVYHNKLLRYPLTVEHECTHGLCVGIIGERKSFSLHILAPPPLSLFSFLFPPNPIIFRKRVS